MVFSTRFSSKTFPKSDRHKKNHRVNLDKSFCTCLVRLGSQIGPCHLTSRVNDKMINYLIGG
jgi:hypothetical protein